VREAAAFGLRSSCLHCAHREAATGACAHGWPNDEQRRWPLDAPGPDGRRPAEVQFCKEFELV
jgi:hypothetical protein